MSALRAVANTTFTDRHAQMKGTPTISSSSTTHVVRTANGANGSPSRYRALQGQDTTTDILGVNSYHECREKPRPATPESLRSQMSTLRRRSGSSRMQKVLMSHIVDANRKPRVECSVVLHCLGEIKSRIKERLSVIMGPRHSQIDLCMTYFDEQLRRLDAICNTSDKLKDCFRAWRGDELRQTKSLVERWVDNLRLRDGRAPFFIWRTATQHCRRTRISVMRYFVKTNHDILFSAYHQWHTISSAFRRRRITLTSRRTLVLSVLAFSTSRSMHKSFAAWHVHARALKLLRRAIGVNLRSIFTVWHRASLEARTTRLLWARAARAASRGAKKKHKIVFSLWVAVAKRRRWLRRITVSMVSGSQNSFLRTCVCEWQEVTRRRLFARQVAQRQMGIMALALHAAVLRVVVVQWRRVASEGRMESAVLNAQSQELRHLLRQCFHQWRTYVITWNAGLKHALLLWHSEYLALLRACVHHWARILTVRAELATRARHQQDMLTIITQSWRNDNASALRQALCAWSRATRQAKVQRIVSVHLLGNQHALLAQQVLHEWRREVLRVRAQSQLQAQKMEGVLIRLSASSGVFLRAAMRAWSVVARKIRQQSKLLRHSTALLMEWHQALLYSSVVEWAAVVRRENNARSLEKRRTIVMQHALRRLTNDATVVLQTVMASWCEGVRLMKRSISALASRAGKSASNWQSLQVLSAWKRYVDDALMRAAVRQQTLCRLLRQWDSEGAAAVSACLRSWLQLVVTGRAVRRAIGQFYKQDAGSGLLEIVLRWHAVARNCATMRQAELLHERNQKHLRQRAVVLLSRRTQSFTSVLLQAWMDITRNQRDLKLQFLRGASSLSLRVALHAWARWVYDHKRELALKKERDMHKQRLLQTLLLRWGDLSCALLREVIRQWRQRCLAPGHARKVARRMAAAVRGHTPLAVVDAWARVAREGRSKRRLAHQRALYLWTQGTALLAQACWQRWTAFVCAQAHARKVLLHMSATHELFIAHLLPMILHRWHGLCSMDKRDRDERATVTRYRQQLLAAAMRNWNTSVAHIIQSCMRHWSYQTRSMRSSYQLAAHVGRKFLGPTLSHCFQAWRLLTSRKSRSSNSRTVRQILSLMEKSAQNAIRSCFRDWVWWAEGRLRLRRVAVRLITGRELHGAAGLLRDSFRAWCERVRRHRAALRRLVGCAMSYSALLINQCVQAWKDVVSKKLKEELEERSRVVVLTPRLRASLLEEMGVEHETLAKRIFNLSATITAYEAFARWRQLIHRPPLDLMALEDLCAKRRCVWETCCRDLRLMISNTDQEICRSVLRRWVWRLEQSMGPLDEAVEEGLLMAQKRRITTSPRLSPRQLAERREMTPERLRARILKCEERIIAFLG